MVKALFKTLLMALASSGIFKGPDSQEPAVFQGNSQQASGDLVNNTIANATSYAESPAYQNLQDPFPSDAYDVAGFLLFLVGQVFHAQVTDVFPTLGLTLSPDSQMYKFKLCPRTAILDCMPYGRPNHVVPSRLRGIYWFDGLGDPSLAVSTGASDYDPVSRVLSGPIYTDWWSWDGTSSKWMGSYWTVSGAAIFNGALFVHFGYKIFFDEDISFGQITVTFKLLGVEFSIPQFLWDFRMKWIGSGVWRRTSYFLVWDVPRGDYFLRRIINEDGSQARWYNRGWLTYRNGIPMGVGAKIWPTDEKASP
eukprot:jgi/Botrbrau1/18727/Bobra.0386s0050.1